MTAARALEWLVIGLGAVLVVVVGWVVVARFVHPIDAEWMTGTIREGVERVRDGQPLYVEPTVRFAPFVYPPLYFWAAALLARVVSTFVACKLVSLAATVATSWGIYTVTRTLGASRWWTRASILLHVATYPLTLHFYDIERVDAFYAAMMVVGVALLVSRDSTRAAALAGVILGLAFFAKQAGALTFVAAVLGLALARERRRAAIVGTAGAVAFALLFLYLEVRTNGWFRFYCLKLPGAHGIQAKRLSVFFISDVPRAFAFAIGSVALAAPVLWSLLRRRTAPEGSTWKDVVLAMVVLAGMAGAFMFRAHAGGWSNVIVAWLPIACVATAVAASRAETRAPGPVVRPLLLGGVCLQLLAAMFDPMELAPDAEDMAERRRLVAMIRELETRGDVWVTVTGGLTKQTFIHTAAVYDIGRAGVRAPADLVAALESRRFAAIVVGRTDELDCGVAACDELSSLLGRSYFVAAARRDREHTGTTGYDGRPRFVMLPRAAPLAPMPLAELYRRQAVERALAEAEAAKLPADTEPAPVPEIEERAAKMLASPREPGTK